MTAICAKRTTGVDVERTYGPRPLEVASGRASGRKEQPRRFLLQLYASAGLEGGEQMGDWLWRSARPKTVEMDCLHFRLRDLLSNFNEIGDAAD